jgi:BolA protein
LLITGYFINKVINRFLNKIVKERITQKLSQNLTIKNLEVINKSHLHQGHLGDNGSGETHFDIIISAKEFDGKTIIYAHRQVNNILRDEFESGLHALSILVV